MVLSNMSEDGEASSFSIDMFDPGSDPVQQPSLPVHQLQEIGAGDFLPTRGKCQTLNLKTPGHVAQILNPRPSELKPSTCFL